MDLQKYERAFDKLPKTIITKHFGNDKSQFDHAKKQMLEIFKKTTHEYPSTSQPFFIPYFMKNLLFHCQNNPEFVGSIIYRNVNENLFSIAGLRGAACTISAFIPPSKETIKTAKSLYQEAHKKLIKIKSSSTILKKDINEVLKLIEPISIAKNYNKNILQAYYIMYLELRISLQLLSHVEDINKTFDFNISLANNDTPVLDLLNHTNFNLDKYSKNPLMASLLDDLKILYSKIEQSSQEPKNYKTPKAITKQPSIVSDSEISIKMSPHPGKKSNNEIMINNHNYKKVQNSPFELLYYLLWFRKNYPDESTGLAINGVIPSDHIIKIINNDDKMNRFSAAWNNKINSRMRNEKSKTVSKINSLLKTRHKIDFDAIVEDGEYYKLTSRFKPDNIELISFQANI